MCVVVDANTLPILLNPRNSRHSEYIDILNWIIFGKSKITLGGYLLKKEIAEKLSSYLPAIMEFSRFQKVHFIDNDEVERETEKVKEKENNDDFDDPHIIALIIVSKARIFCSDDARSFKFVNDVKFYPKNYSKPKIFTSINHKPQKKLLCDNNICCLGTHESLNRTNAQILWDKYN